MNDLQRLELADYRMKKATATFSEVALLVENELWNTAVNRLYYACFYAVSALLIFHNIQSKTHSGTRQLFGLHFIKTGIVEKETGKFFSYLFDQRQTGDYDDFYDFEKEDVSGLIEPTKTLLFTIEKLIILEQN